MGPPKLHWIHQVFTYPNELDHWIEGQLFFNIKSLNLWATDEGVRGMGLTPNLIYGPILGVSFYPPKFHDQWGPWWALSSLVMHGCTWMSPIYVYIYIYIFEIQVQNVFPKFQITTEIFRFGGWTKTGSETKLGTMPSTYIEKLPKGAIAGQHWTCPKHPNSQMSLSLFIPYWYYP